MLTPTATTEQGKQPFMAGADPHLYNDDLAPTTPANRTWGTYNYIALWFSMSMEVTTCLLYTSRCV